MKRLLLLLFYFLSFSSFATTYYVSPEGDNTKDGRSEENAFKMVQFAIDAMNAGDTLIVMDGLYMSRTFKLKSDIVIKAQHPRKAVFSGLEKVNGNFEEHAPNIYKTSIDGNPKQVFFNNQPMSWASWPNVKWSQNWKEDKKWATATTGTGPGVLTSNQFNEINNLNLEEGYCFIRYGKGNSCYSRKIESFDGTILNWNDDNFYTSKYTGEDGWRGSAEALLSMDESHDWHPNKSKFFLAGDLDLLDAEREWFVENNTLYLYPINGVHPNDAQIFTQVVDYSINEEEPLSNITIEGVDFVGTSVKFGNALNSNIHFSDVHFSYIGGALLFIDRVESDKVDKPIFVKGTGISFEKCLFAGAQNTALSVEGGDILVENCVFMENNRHANFESRALLIDALGTYKVTKNTFFNNCSDAIRVTVDNNFIESATPEISYNNVFNGGKYNSDVSGIYMPLKSQKYVEVHHNWVHNMHGTSFRLDLVGKELSLHHNVFWASKRGMSIEGHGQFNIYNNTDLHNEVPSDLTRNVLDHAGSSDASNETNFPPINDWNVLNNLVEHFNDRVGPREKSFYTEQRDAGLVHNLRASTDIISVVDRGDIQGNLIGERRDIFVNGNLSNLNVIPTDPVIKNGESSNAQLVSENVTDLDSFRGAYALQGQGDEWITGSDWMPNSLGVLTSVASSESFAKDNYSTSYTPEFTVSELPFSTLNHHPVAVVGEDQLVQEGTLVTLDASMSTDVDIEDSLSYKWSAPEGIQLNDASLAQPRFIAPNVDGITSYIFSVVVNDGHVDSAPKNVIVEVENNPLIQEVNVEIKALQDHDYGINNIATMVSETQTGPDGLATYQIALDVIPTTGNGIKSGYSSGVATANSWGISTNSGETTDMMFVGEEQQFVESIENVRVINFSANGGMHTLADFQNLSISKIKIINAHSTNDLVKIKFDSFSYELGYFDDKTQSLKLEAITGKQPLLDFKLGTGTSYVDSLNRWSVESLEVKCLITLQLPVADAGDDIYTEEGETIVLDGSTSFDPNGLPLTYEWIAPAGIILFNSNSSTPSFIAPNVTEETDFDFQLTVNNGQESSLVDTVKVRVLNNELPDEISVTIKASPNTTYGVNNVATMISEVQTAIDGVATYQVAIDVEPKANQTIMSGITSGDATTKSWGVGDGTNSTQDIMFRESDNVEWVKSISTIRIVNFNANGGNLSLSNFSNLYFKSVNVVNGHVDTDAVSLKVNGNQTDLGSLPDRNTNIDLEVTTSMDSISSFSIGTGSSSDPVLNKWQIEGIDVKFKMLDDIPSPNNENVQIKALANTNYGLNNVVTMVSEVETAFDGLATYQVSIDVTPKNATAIQSGYSSGDATTKSWGIGIGGTTTHDIMFSGNANEWVENIDNIQIVNFNANGGQLTQNDIIGTSFKSITVVNAHVSTDAVSLKVNNVVTDLGFLMDRVTEIDLENETGSASIQHFSIGIGQSQDQNLNKWVVETIGVNVSFDQDSNGRKNTTVDEVRSVVFPNPSSGSFIIDIKKKQATTYTLYSITGVKVKSGSFNGSKQLVNTEGIQHGIYMLEINTAENRFLHKLIVK
ncbi:PKD domain-containing protein [Flammeovirga pacifica]|uniref:Secretion system C-terminal sorting domain-containing protein n=1 Tax=Flammeovirga pacifica TaxID=915059 RepID=A0A1S1YRZ9_FLAPC|nr:T9SS type A sorting domain-containing protein [Flammeovirga pacifica]OHX63807.1 hypothetical protein NH26_24755 [Flammeovirga pacifica]